MSDPKLTVSRGWVPDTFQVKVRLDAGPPKFVHLSRDELELLRKRLAVLLDRFEPLESRRNHPLPPRRLLNVDANI